MGDVNSWELTCVLVCFCCFLLYPLEGTSPWGWRRPMSCCHVPCLCVSGSTTVFAVGSCYAVACVGYFSFMREAGSITILWVFTVLLIVITLLSFLCRNRTVIFTVCAWCLVHSVWWLFSCTAVYYRCMSLNTTQWHSCVWLPTFPKFSHTQWGWYNS